MSCRLSESWPGNSLTSHPKIGQSRPFIGGQPSEGNTAVTTNVSTGQGPRSVSGAQPLAIDLTGLHKSFGPVEAVKGIDLNIAQGEVVAFLGPNGAGKTT